MPRKPRIDAPGHLYHVIAKGIEDREIFADDQDREVFLKRLGRVVLETETPIYAFALIPNHLHLLLRRAQAPISRIMQRLLTSYAIYFNKRHDRHGHLFQNRYKSIICDEQIYLLELIRYINLNPLRSNVVDSVGELSRYRYCSHRLMVGRGNFEWFDPCQILAFFSVREPAAKRAYSRFVEAGVKQENIEELEGKGRNRFLHSDADDMDDMQVRDTRIIGSANFMRELGMQEKKIADRDCEARKIMERVCAERCVEIAELLGKGRVRRVSAARAKAAQELQEELGLSVSEVSRQLSVTRRAAAKMIEKSRTLSAARK